jgi:hypothetical protein
MWTGLSRIVGKRPEIPPSESEVKEEEERESMLTSSEASRAL